MGNPWFEHVDKFRKQNPDLSYSEALKQAKKTYVPVIKNCPPCSSKDNKKKSKSNKSSEKENNKNNKVSKKSDKKSKKSKKDKKDKKSKRKPSAWNIHVMDTKKKNPNMAFKDILVEAGKTYKKK